MIILMTLSDCDLGRAAAGLSSLVRISQILKFQEKWRKKSQAT